MTKLIINGDDFGYSRGVNEGIMEAHKKGILTSTSLLTNMPGADQAYEIAAENPSLGVGIHLNLTIGKPVLPGHQTIVGENGNFHSLSFYEGSYNIDPHEVYFEWKAQIERALERGLKPTHLDSHHHIHSHLGITEVLVNLAEEYELPTRRLDSGKTFVDAVQVERVNVTERFENDVKVLRQPPEKLRTAFEGAETVEIMTHPGYLDKELKEQSSLLEPRLEDLEVLLDEEVKKNLAESGIELINYRDLQKCAV